MKKIWTIFMLFICAGIASAKIVTPNFLPTKDEEEMAVAYYQLKNFTPYDVPEEYQQELSVNQAFKVKFNGCDGEIRYSLFKETGENTELTIGAYFYVIMMNLTGEKGTVTPPTAFKDSDVAKDFNGTSGYCCTVRNPSSLFAKGYEFINIEFFYKKGHGVCVRTTLYNDAEFVVKKYGSMEINADFLKYYKSFRFLAKDKDGKFVRHYARIATFNFEPAKDEKEFDVIYYNPKNFATYDVPEECQQEISVNKAFKVNFNGCDGEIRYSLFKETGENALGLVRVYANMLLIDLAGGNGASTKLINFDKSIVKNDINGTSAYSCTVFNPNSVFASGYKFIEVNFYYKKGQGLCVRTMLYNDMEFYKCGPKKLNEDYMKYYRGFRFMDKDKDGKYIKPAVK